MQDMLPDRFAILHKPHVAKRGGGVAVIHNKTISVKRDLQASNESTSFEAHVIQSAYTAHHPCQLVPSQRNLSLLYLCYLKSTNLLVCCDINIYLDQNDNPQTIKFLDILELFSLKQLVSSSTHVRGHMLDVAATNCSQLPFPLVSKLLGLVLKSPMKHL